MRTLPSARIVLAGAAVNFGLTRLHNAASSLEHMVRDGNHDHIVDAINLMTNEASLSQAAIVELCETLCTAPAQSDLIFD